MDGTRLQQYWSNEMQSMLDIYRQFQILIPAEVEDGAAHKGEDGRYVETLIRECLKRYLPRDLEVLTGFILRPAVKTGLDNKSRKTESDSHSTQLDIIVYDSARFPIFQRFGDNVIVPPEGVIGIISVKKNLHDADIEKETDALKQASKLCHCQDNRSNNIRGPFLALVSMGCQIEKKRTSTEEWIFEKIQCVFDNNDYFDDLIGYIGAFDQWSIFKRRPKGKSKKAEYCYFKHEQNEQCLGFQFLLTGLLSVYYDASRNTVSRPGFTAFPSGRNYNSLLGTITTKGPRIPVEGHSVTN